MRLLVLLAALALAGGWMHLRAEAPQTLVVAAPQGQQLDEVEMSTTDGSWGAWAIGLLVGGMSGEMPVAMIENASLPEQRECRSSLAAMQLDAAAFALKSPAILVIGEVVRASSSLSMPQRLHA